MASNEREWTLAVDLAVNLDTPGQYGHLGAEDKMTRLRQLQAQTKDSPVTIVAQQIVPETQDGKKSFVLKRYAIHDNKIDDISPVPPESKGTAQDLSDLLKVAGDQYPSAKLGLVTNSHGNGDQGLMGDNGAVSLNQLQKSIKDGLEPSGRSKLDFLNFDACLMSQVGVLDKMAPVAKQLVASQTPENAEEGSPVDGQNLNAWVGDLLKKPQMDGRQLAQDVVRRADSGANDADGLSGTNTLAHFNLEQPFNRFEKSFDQYGEALAKAAIDPKNKEAIRSAIDGSRGKPELQNIFQELGGLTAKSYASQLKDQKVDFGTFSGNIEKLIKSGKISDADGSLARASAEMQTSQKAMTEQFHGPISASGLSVFLPDSEHLDTKGIGERSTAVGRILDFTDPKTPIGVRSINIPPLQDELKQLQKQMGKDSDARGPLQSATAAMERINRLGQSGAPDRALEQAESALRASTMQLEGTQTFKHDAGERQKQAERILSGEERTQSETAKKSWPKFIHSVQ